MKAKFQKGAGLPNKACTIQRPAYQVLRTSLICGGEEGNTIVFTLIFVLIVLTTSLMVSNRGLSGLLGSLFNQESKLARDAAEIGILRAIMLLNEPQNRELLVHADDINNLSATNAATSIKYRHKCYDPDKVPIPPDITVSGSAMGIKSPSGTSYPTITIDDGSAAAGIQRKFRILSIAQSGLPSLEDERIGGIIITVQGQALKNGRVIATSKVTREFEVIEKCCGLSLGGPGGVFGGDQRSCDRGNPGLGLIAGTYFKDNGSFDTTGGSGISFRDENGDPIEAVYCLDESPDNDCSSGGLNSGTGTRLVEVKARLNDVPSIPTIPSGSTVTSCDGVTSESCEILIDDDLTLSTADFENWGVSVTSTTCTLTSCETSISTSPILVTSTVVTASVVSNILQCEGNKRPVDSCQNKNDTYIGSPATLTVQQTSTSIITAGTTTSTIITGLSTTVVSGNPEIADLKSHCFQTSESGVTVTYCSIDRIEIANNRKLTVDTTGGPIRFYFPNASTADNPSIELKNGRSGIIQSNTDKSPLSYTDLTFYGIPRSEQSAKCSAEDYAEACQQIELGGGNAGSTSFFAYFPSGEMTLQGTATINGVIWSNVINATGSVNFVTSSSGVGDVLSLIGIGGQSPGSGGTIGLVTDYVTRLTKSFRFF